MKLSLTPGMKLMAKGMPLSLNPGYCHGNLSSFRCNQIQHKDSASKKKKPLKTMETKHPNNSHILESHNCKLLLFCSLGFSNSISHSVFKHPSCWYLLINWRLENNILITHRTAFTSFHPFQNACKVKVMITFCAEFWILRIILF